MLLTFAAANAASAADLLRKAPTLVPLTWSWAGLYIGAHAGGASGVADFADPFGTSIYGDQVRTPAFLGGAQVGYNWQTPGSSWVFGLEGDASFLDSDGTNTCFATSARVIAESCRVRPQATATLTGRIGYAAGRSGRTLIYAKGGAAWMHSQVDMATDNLFNGELFAGHTIGPVVTANSSTASAWGWTLGAGIEHALTPAWSVRLEYDYLGFAGMSVPNLGSVTTLAGPLLNFGLITATAPPGMSGLTQNIQEVKLGVNYRLNADPMAGWGASAMAFPVKGVVAPLADWEFEGGTRTMFSEGRFQKNLGPTLSLQLPPTSDISRLTYAGLQTNSGEMFGRIETPWSVFFKGFVGGGSTGNGHLNDEDFGSNFNNTFEAYSNTYSSNATGKIAYSAIDAGYELVRDPAYKLGPFAGYFYLNQTIDAFGCVPVADVRCTPPVPATGNAIVSEADTWQALRLGVAGEAMIFDRVKLSGEVAYLPYVSFTGTDFHFFGNTGILGAVFDQEAKGRGVQLEALASYYVLPQFSLGLGARYWAMWGHGQYTEPVQAPETPPVAFTPVPPHASTAALEQGGVFIQAAYGLGAPEIRASPLSAMFSATPTWPSFAAASAAAAASVTGGPAELGNLNRQILKNPKNAALNLRYAALAERLGEQRLALAAYERVLVDDPSNAEAQRGVDRVRARLQPETTQYQVEVGSALESNPRYLMAPINNGEAQLLTNLSIRDERFFGDTRFRTLATGNLILHGSDNDLDYGYLGVSSGPVWELLPGLLVNPALGGGGAMFDNKPFYGEVTAGTSFEAYPGGAYQMVRIRAGLRGYNEDFYPSGEGGYVDAVGRFTVPTALADTAFTLSPWARWSDISGPRGNIDILLFPDNQPGDYSEVGNRFEVAHSFADWIIGGANLAVSERFYRADSVAGGTDQRRDTLVSPGASIVFPHLITNSGDLRLDYRYLWNRSNDPSQAFIDQVITAKTVFRF